MTEKEIRAWLEKVESDERIHMKSADVVTNAPLALEQMRLETSSYLLRRILGQPHFQHNPAIGFGRTRKGRLGRLDFPGCPRAVGCT